MDEQNTTPPSLSNWCSCYAHNCGNNYRQRGCSMEGGGGEEREGGGEGEGRGGKGGVIITDEAVAVTCQTTRIGIAARLSAPFPCLGFPSSPHGGPGRAVCANFTYFTYWVFLLRFPLAHWFFERDLDLRLLALAACLLPPFASVVLIIFSIHSGLFPIRL